MLVNPHTDYPDGDPDLNNGYFDYIMIRQSEVIKYLITPPPPKKNSIRNINLQKDVFKC